MFRNVRLSKSQELWEFVDQHAEALQRQGSVVKTWRRQGDRRLGPYFLLVYRENGRQRTRYIGGDGEVANEIRQRLAELQTIRCQRRIARTQRMIMREALASSKSEWKRELAKIGLSLKGFEVRGWRGLALAEKTRTTSARGEA